MQTAPVIEKNEVFELAYRFVTETNENIFLTGKAGTGKTTFLKYLKANSTKNILVAAPTGVAAINAGGVTLHSLFQLPFHPFIPSDINKRDFVSQLRLNKYRLDLLRKMEVLVIDEVSMVRCDTMDAIDEILRVVRRQANMPFGGVQLLCIGDLYQLPPVVRRDEWMLLREYYSTPFFFDSLAMQEQLPLLIELNKIYRQKEDSFVRILNRVRNNEMDEDDFEDLHMRYDPGFSPAVDERYITLTTHNNQADEINNTELNKLLAASKMYQATIEGEFAENNYPADGSLVLKNGAQVMFLKNDLLKRYYNGKIGVVKKLLEDEIVVECDGVDIEVLPEIWENTRYVIGDDGKLEQEIVGSFKQFPLRLAYAITIHKSQGLTFEKVMIDAGKSFSSGQVYVALSRCTSLDGIVLLSKIPPTALISDESVVKGQKSLAHRGSLAERFEGARFVFTLQLLEELFSFTEAVTYSSFLLKSIGKNKQKLNEGAIDWALDLHHLLEENSKTGRRFVSQLASFLGEERVIENNEKVKKRLMEASTYFCPRFSALMLQVEEHPLVTEYVDVANVVNADLKSLYTALLNYHHQLIYCNDAFTITGYLKHKISVPAAKARISCYASNKKNMSGNFANAALYQMLKDWRDKICDDQHLPIYMVANQESLKEIAKFLPVTNKDLAAIKGFGKAKVNRFGAEIIGIVEDYCNTIGVQSNMSAMKPKKEAKAPVTAVQQKTATSEISYNMFKEGKTVEEIAKERNFVRSTIEGHLMPFVEQGEIDIHKLVPEHKQKLIAEAVKVNGTESFKTLKENLPEDISYSDIRFVIAAQKPV